MMENLKKEWRFYFIAIFLLMLLVILIVRMLMIQVVDVNGELTFIQGQGDARTLRLEKIIANRGIISDRNGQPLAVSTPVVSIFINPQNFNINDINEDTLLQLTKLVGVSIAQLKEKLEIYKNKQFFYLKRQLAPAQAEEILALKIKGVNGKEEYHRFYPAGEIAAHIVGYTNVKEVGQEGIELAYEKELQGHDGSKQIVKDLFGNTIKDIKQLDDPVSGKNITLSIDLRLQYLAYRALKVAVKQHNADGGSVVMLDVKTGEVLAMVNQPAFNPNDRSEMQFASIRNRAMTDSFEPGSTMKPHTIIAALESGKYTPDTKIDTFPGYIRVNGKTLVDHNNYGLIDVTRVITKSSQVGITKITLSLDQNDVSNAFERMGIGQPVSTGFPGEISGSLPVRKKWSDIERAAFAFGNGVTVSALQLARSYAIFANNGVKMPISLLRLDSVPTGERVMSEQIAQQINKMLETVVSAEGTAKRAKTDSYQVAGKTGTTHKINPNGGYEAKKYISIFAGFAPVESPRIAAVVVVDNPKGAEYFGGAVAAPVFSEVVGGSLRMLNVAPDEEVLPKLTQPENVVAVGGVRL